MRRGDMALALAVVLTMATALLLSFVGVQW